LNLILLSDLHLTSINPVGRKDNVLTTGLEKLEYVLNYAVDHEVRFILQAGDFCDKSRDWNLLSKLHRLLDAYKVPILCVSGQHDYYYRSSETDNASTMGILHQSGLVAILREPKEIYDPSRIVYPVSWGNKIPVPKKNNLLNILLAHVPIAQQKVYPTQKVTTKRKFNQLLKTWDLMLLGDIHRYLLISQGNRHIVNTGSMMRLESTEYNMTHQPCFYLYNIHSKKLKKEIIPHKPADEILHTHYIKPETEDDYNEKKLNKLAREMAIRFKDDPNKLKIRKILESKKVRKAVKKIVINVMNKIKEQ